MTLINKLCHKALVTGVVSTDRCLISKSNASCLKIGVHRLNSCEIIDDPITSGSCQQSCGINLVLSLPDTASLIRGCLYQPVTEKC